MYINIANNLVTMVRNTDYKPVWVNTSPQLKNSFGSPHDSGNDAASAMCGPGYYNKYPIFRIQVAKNTMSDYLIRLWLYGTDTAAPIDVPYSAFSHGFTYDMFVAKYTIVNASGVEVTDQDANFILIGHLGGAVPLMM